MTQWDLSTMTSEMQYNLVDYANDCYSIVINKNQTLLALHTSERNKKFDIYSMETGIHISNYSQY